MLTHSDRTTSLIPIAFCALAFSALLQSACGSRLVLGDTPDAAGAAGTAGPSGQGGAGLAGTAGTAGTLGSIGGASGTGGAGATPLPIAAKDALTRVAAVLWNSPPDAALLAQAGQITSIAALQGVIQQMLADPRAAAGVGAFYRWWLNLSALAQLSKDTATFPSYTPELQADVALETETFGVNVTLAMNGSYQTLLTAGFSFIDARLADIYGVGGVTGETLQQVTLPAGQRAGLLTQPALQALGSIATRNSPPHRGDYIEARFLCQQVGPPPPNLSTTQLDLSQPGITLRQALAINVQQSAACVGCHQLLDPFGDAFEGFDAIGRTRTIDNGAPVDVSGLNIMSLSVSPTLVNGPIELANAIAGDATAHDCMARKWLSFALGRDLQSADDAAVTQIDAAFSAAGFNLKALIAAVLTSGPFLAP
jgi:hypothetical protein